MNRPFRPRQRAVRTQRHGRHLHAVLVLQGFQRAKRVGAAGPGAGKFGTGHQVIDVRQHAVKAMVDGIDIHGDGNAVLAGDAGRARYRRGIVAVDVQQARAGDLVLGNLVGLDA